MTALRARAAVQAATVGPNPGDHAGDHLGPVIQFVDDLSAEIGAMFEPNTPNPHFNMLTYLMRRHLEGRTVTVTALAAASGVPYATAMRRISELTAAGFIDHRQRTRSGKRRSLHPSEKLIQRWGVFSSRLRRMVRQAFTAAADEGEDKEYYYGGSYKEGRVIQPPQVLPEPLKLSGGLRTLVHSDPTFMVMRNLKRQFEQVLGTTITQRAFSIDRLRAEILRNSARSTSLYDIVAFDMPWIGELATKGVLLPLDEIMDLSRLDPGDFHTAGWRGAHWGGRPYGVPSQTTPELLFYRKDRFAAADLAPPTSVATLLKAAQALHDPQRHRYGIAWNGARGTALGHTFIMTCADFGQPVIEMDAVAGGFDADNLDRDDIVPTLDTPLGREAARFLIKLLEYSPPDILSMSWYERVKPYAAGRVAMAYGYTLLAPYFDLDPESEAYGNTAYLPHPPGLHRSPVAPIGGYLLAIPANIAPERIPGAVEALIAVTTPEAQKTYVMHGSRTVPRFSVGADPSVRRLSPIFEAVDTMSWRDELQFWPRPPIPEFSELVAICGDEIHQMLRGITSPEQALSRAQARAEIALKRN